MFEDADIISRYSRADAFRDGTLVDMTAAAREAGIRYPTALTRAANALIWLVYAGFMIWMIFRIFTSSYAPLLGL